MDCRKVYGMPDLHSLKPSIVGRETFHFMMLLNMKTAQLL